MKNEIIKYDKSNAIDIKRAAWSSLSVESQKAYQSDFNLFFSFVNKNTGDVTPNNILDYIKKLENDGMKNSTINRKIASISKMFHILEIAGEIKKNPVQILKNMKNISRKISKGINISLTILDIKKATRVDRYSTEQEKKLSLIIRILFSTGLRISEFINIKKSDIYPYNKSTNKIRIVGKGKRERFIFLSRLLCNEISRLYPINDKIDNLFYSGRFHPLNRFNLWKQIRKVFLDNLGMYVHPHTLRHAFITHKISVEKQDVRAVSKYVGHQDVAVTLNMYVDTALDEKTSKIKI